MKTHKAYLWWFDVCYPISFTGIDFTKLSGQYSINTKLMRVQGRVKSKSLAKGNIRKVCQLIQGKRASE